MKKLTDEEIGENIYKLISKKDMNEIKEGKDNGSEILEISVNDIVPNKNQPRENFDEDNLLSLAESIEENGLIQPIIIKKLGDKYELIAGERRLRAVKLLDMEKIPAIIRDIDDKKSAKLALIENIQREDLTPVEEALAYKNMIENYNVTQKELSKSIGKSRPYISNTIRLLDLDEQVLDHINNNLISIGHGKAILALDDKETQRKLAKEIMDKGLSVRETERIIKKINEEKPNEEKVDPNVIMEKDNYLITLEEQLMMSLGTKVNLIPGKKKGIIEIEYYTEDDLGRIIERLQ